MSHSQRPFFASYHGGIYGQEEEMLAKSKETDKKLKALRADLKNAHAHAQADADAQAYDHAHAHAHA